MQLWVSFIFLAMLNAGSGKVIVNSSNTQAITSLDVKKIFLGKKTLWDNRSTSMVSYPNTLDSVGLNFFEIVINKKHKKFKKYWVKKVFSGNGTPPKMLNTDADVAKFVAQNPGGIGFISDDSVLNDKLRVLDITW